MSNAFSLVVSFLSSLGVGYGLGILYKSSVSENKNKLQSSKVEEETTNDDDIDGILDGDLSAISAGLLQPCKIVLVVRTDLKLTPGSIAILCGDATLLCYKVLLEKNKSLVRHWERTGQAKIVLKIKSEEEFMELEAIAKSVNLCARSVKDRSVLAIGPAPVDLVNEVTGKLRLL